MLVQAGWQGRQPQMCQMCSPPWTELHDLGRMCWPLARHRMLRLVQLHTSPGGLRAGADAPCPQAHVGFLCIADPPAKPSPAAPTALHSAIQSHKPPLPALCYGAHRLLVNRCPCDGCMGARLGTLAYPDEIESRPHSGKRSDHEDQEMVQSQEDARMAALAPQRLA